MATALRPGLARLASMGFITDRVWPARFGVVEALTRRGSHLGLFGHDSFRSGDCGEEADRPRSAEGRDKSCKRLEVRNVAF